MSSHLLIKSGILALSLGILTACSTAQTAPVCDGSSSGGPGDVANVQASGIGGGGTSFGGEGSESSLRVCNQRYHFDFDRSDVRDADMPSLKVQAHYLATHPRAKVLLAGNTDDRGSREYNIGLGDRRARSVEAALEAEGVSKNQITTVSYGAEKPIVTGQDEDSYAQNRRVDLIYQTSIG